MRAAPHDLGIDPDWTNANCWANRCSGSPEGEVDDAGLSRARTGSLMSPGGVPGLEALAPERHLHLGVVKRHSKLTPWRHQKLTPEETAYVDPQ